jgi:hypothetical protein
MQLKQLVYQECHQEGFPPVLDWLHPCYCRFLWDEEDEGQCLTANKGHKATSKFRLNKLHKQCKLDKH